MTGSRVTVSRSLITAMQAVQDAVSVHPYAVSADLPRAALRRVLGKLRARLPDLERDRWHASRRRAAGLPSHVLVIYWPKPGQTGWFVLLSSADDPAAGERWQDVRQRKTRLRIRAGWWELVRHTAPGAKAPRWTWRMAAERRAALIEQFDEATAKGWRDWLTRVAQQSRRWPGFAGIRADHAAIGKHLTRRWMRTQRGEAPEWPRLPYVTRRARTPRRPGV